MSELTELRREIDALDDALLRLAEARTLAAQRAVIVRGGGRDEDREREIRGRLSSDVVDDEQISALWDVLLSMSRGPDKEFELTLPDEELEPAELTDEEAEELAEALEQESDTFVQLGDDNPSQILLGDDSWGRVPKPPYNVPTVEQISATEKNGLTLVSTFSGCGGSSLGFRMDGWNVLYVNEFIEAARDSYLANFPDTFVDPRDIRDVTAEDLLGKIGLERGEVDVLEGSPPCASFSMAGKREESWGKVKKYSETEQRVDDLFYEFARLVEGVQPKVFVAENVPGLLIGTARSVLHAVMQRMREAGYLVTGRVLNAADFGVPQRRRRLILMGVRRDLADAGHRPAFPQPFGYQYMLRDVLPGITHAMYDTGGQFRKEDFTNGIVPTVTTATAGHMKVEGFPFIGVPTPEDIEVELTSSIDAYAIGDEWLKLSPGQQSERYFNLIRAHPDEPCPTVTQTGSQLGAAAVTHPHEKRKFTIPELRVICGFPLDFKLTGSYQQRYERLGRAVPPPLMRAVASTIRQEVLCAE